MILKKKSYFRISMLIDILILSTLDSSIRQKSKENKQLNKTSRYFNLKVFHLHWKKKLLKQKLICKLQKATCFTLIHMMQRLLVNLDRRIITPVRHHPLIHLFNTKSRSKGALCQMLQP
jgi:hypothetical protein